MRIKTFVQRLENPAPAEASPGFPLSPAAAAQQRITRRTAMQETMLTGLRLTREGISAEDFQQRHGMELTEVFGKDIEELVRLGLLEWAEESRVRLTPRGRLLGNQVFIRFVGE
jgi:oxygen-independent coproporphyrinogen-3 oxidase